MKFGLYLKKKGVITAEELVAALDHQHSRMPPIGQVAMEEGVLSARQVFKVLRCQSGISARAFRRGGRRHGDDDAGRAAAAADDPMGAQAVSWPMCSFGCGS